MKAQSRRKLADTESTSTSSSTAPSRSLESVAGEAAGSVPSLDAIIHERSRLAILTALVTGDARAHTELRELLGLTDGNLSVHARKLEDAGYVTCAKEFAGRTPRTTYRITAMGRRAFERYLAHLEGLISAMKTRP
ncbi:MAG TPA: transcriptional regulator [Gemmatimonas sp.]|nr:transcriptional regulator [Gemmatimonas sp.]